jgi:DNA-binding XRE family transcriptional regulator
MATKEDIRKVREDLAQIQSAIGDTVSVSNETIDEKIDDHESRISKLEHQST